MSGPRTFKAWSDHALDLNGVGETLLQPVKFFHQKPTQEFAMIRIAQFSDLHYSARNLVEADRCFRHAVDRAIALKVDAAVVSGDSTDHALDLHSPAVERLARNIRRLADHCPVLMLQGTFSHEPPGTLSMFRLLGGRYPVHVADRIGQVFDSFTQADSAIARQFGGTGLGLSIVKHVATKHGGDVSVWSAPAVGSTFALRLPIYSNTGETHS